MNSKHLVIYCACPDAATAERIARTLVEERLAACVNIVPGATSVYHWRGAIQCDPETLLIIKSNAARYPALEARVQELHPYEVPEIIALPMQQGAAGYLAWLDDALQSPL